MKLPAVSVSTGVEVPFGTGTVRTGILKRPVSGRVRVRTLNLEGDRQLDTKAHGGIHRTVYAYPWENHGQARRRRIIVAG
jgi:MOSC domain-containing protein YiiM